MRVATRVAAAIALGVLPAACATGCGGSSSNSDLTPADVQRFLAVKEATDNFSFLVELINTADGSVRSLETTPGHSAGGLQGAKLSWDHVLLGLNMFHPAQAAAVPGLATTILATRQVAIQWGNALNGVTPHTSHHKLTVRFAPVVKLEVKARKPLNATAAALARMACSLERKSTLLASQSVLHDDCANAASLSKLAKG